MTKRTLLITMNADWRAALRAAGKRATAGSYQGEVLNFESAGGSSASSRSGVELHRPKYRLRGGQP